LARRSVGLHYNRLGYGQFFNDFCCVLYKYQYTKQKTEISPAIIEWLYEHSGGVISVVVSLIHDAQEIAILNGTEELNMATLNESYEKRLSMLHGYIEPTIKRRLQCSTPKKKSSAASITPIQAKADVGIRINELVAIAKNDNADIVELLKQHMPVVEVAV